MGTYYDVHGRLELSRRAWDVLCANEHVGAAIVDPDLECYYCERDEDHCEDCGLVDATIEAEQVDDEEESIRACTSDP